MLKSGDNIQLASTQDTSHRLWVTENKSNVNTSAVGCVAAVARIRPTTVCGGSIIVAVVEMAADTLGMIELGAAILAWCHFKACAIGPGARLQLDYFSNVDHI